MSALSSIRFARANRALAVATAGLALVGGAALPAHAQRTVVHDGQDTRARAELTDVTVMNQHRRVVVVLHYNDVSYLHDGEYPFGIWYDTAAVRHGPEYMLPSHFNAIYGTEDKRHWTADVDRESRCYLDGKIHPHHNTFRITAGRACFGGHTASVRVSVAVTEPGPGHRFVQDWAPAYHRFSAWVRRS